MKVLPSYKVIIKVLNGFGLYDTKENAVLDAFYRTRRPPTKALASCMKQALDEYPSNKELFQIYKKRQDKLPVPEVPSPSDVARTQSHLLSFASLNKVPRKPKTLSYGVLFSLSIGVLSKAIPTEDGKVVLPNISDVVEQGMRHLVESPSLSSFARVLPEDCLDSEIIAETVSNMIMTSPVGKDVVEILPSAETTNIEDDGSNIPTVKNIAPMPEEEESHALAMPFMDEDNSASMAEDEECVTCDEGPKSSAEVARKRRESLVKRITDLLSS